MCFITAWLLVGRPRTLAHHAPVSRPNMASADGCPYCSKVFGAESQRSKSTHVGICRVKQSRARSESKRRADEEQDAAGKRRRIDASTALVPADSLLQDDASFDPTAFSTADAAWMTLYLQRRDVSSSLIDDILPLCALGVAPRFSTAHAFFEMVDALPGPSFRLSRITLPDVPGQVFDFAYRPTLAVLQDMLHRFNGAFLDPEEVAATTERDPEFVDGTRFRQLQQRLTDAVGPEAVLMPLIFSSGLCCVSFWVTFYLACSSVFELVGRGGDTVVTPKCRQDKSRQVQRRRTGQQSPSCLHLTRYVAVVVVDGVWMVHCACAFLY